MSADDAATVIRIRKAGKRYLIQNGELRTRVDDLEELADNVDVLTRTSLTLSVSEDELREVLDAYMEAEGTRRRPHPVPFFFDGKHAYEAVEIEDGLPFFLTFGDDGTYRLVQAVDASRGIVFAPEDLGEGAYILERDDVTKFGVPKLADLYGRVLSVVQDYFATPDSRTHKLVAMMIVHAYVLAKSNGTAFLWLVGPKRSGKNTLQRIVELIGYRVFTGVKPTESSIYRTLGTEVEYAPTVVIKEYNWASEFLKEIAREGNIPGSKKPQSEPLPTGGYRVVSYWLYGWRVVGSNNLHGVEADFDRYFVLQCMHLAPARPRSELLRDTKVIETLSQLRRDLLLWKVAVLAALEFPYVDPRGELFDRDWENFGGVLTLAKQVSPDLEMELRGYVLEYIAAKQNDETGGAYSILLSAVQELAIKDHAYGDGYRIPFKAIWEVVQKSTGEGEGRDGRPVRVTPNGETLTETKAGRLLREQIAGTRDKWWEPGRDGRLVNVRGYTWTKKVLTALETGKTGETGYVHGNNGPEPKEEGHEAEEGRGGIPPPPDPQPVSPVTPVSRRKGGSGWDTALSNPRGSFTFRQWAIKNRRQDAGTSELESLLDEIRTGSKDLTASEARSRVESFAGNLERHGEGGRDLFADVAMLIDFDTIEERERMTDSLKRQLEGLQPQIGEALATGLISKEDAAGLLDLAPVERLTSKKMLAYQDRIRQLENRLKAEEGKKLEQANPETAHPLPHKQPTPVGLEAFM